MMIKYPVLIVLVFLALSITSTFWGVPGPGPRQQHCFLQYNANFALLFGGQNIQSTPLNDVHLYNLVTNRWLNVVTFGHVPSPRVNPICFAINSTTIYVYGGYDSDEYATYAEVFSDIYSLDIPSLTWRAQPESPVQQGGGVGVFVGDLFIVFGGQTYVQGMSYYSKEPCSNVTMLFYPGLGQWIQWNGLNGPSARCYASIAAMNNKAYLTGGMTTAPFPSAPDMMNVWEFDVVTLQWSSLGSFGDLPSPRGLSLMVSNPANRQLYLLGGTNVNGQSFDDTIVYRFDMLSNNNNSWTLVGRVSTGTFSLAGFFANGTIFFNGGWTGSTDSAALYAFDVQTYQTIDLSTVDDSLSASRQRIMYAAAMYNTSWFVFGGAKQQVSAPVNDLAVFDMVKLSWSTVTQTGTIPLPRFMHSFVAMDHFGIVYGGSSANLETSFNDTYIIDFQTKNWTPLLTNIGPLGRCGHSAVMWNEMMVVFGGEDCCFNFNDVWMLDLADISSPIWTEAVPSNSDSNDIPGERWNHCATIEGDRMFIFGGSPAFNDVWSFDLVLFTWTQFAPTLSPSVRTTAANILVYPQWYINGGQDELGQPLGDTWAFNVQDYTWTQIDTLDLNTPTPQSVMQHQGVVSPFNDQMLIWGPGATSFVTQVLSPGYHDVSVSQTMGSDVACQLKETEPCETFAFALSRFAGDSYLEFTVSANLRSIITIGTSQLVYNVQLGVPVLIQGSGTNIVLDCQMTRCFTLTDIVSNPFTLANVILRNGSAQMGGAIAAINSFVSLQTVTMQNNYANEQGGAIYLHDSTLSVDDTRFVDNRAGVSGGAIYADASSSIVVQMSEFTNNQAGTLGGAICTIATNLELTSTHFSTNSVNATGNLLIGGGAVYSIVSNVDIVNCSFVDNRVTSSSVNYGGGVLLYSSPDHVVDTIFLRNFANFGGGIAILSDPLDVAQALATVIPTSSVYFANNVWQYNIAQDSGGAIYISDTTVVQMISCSLIENMAGMNGGAAILSTSSAIINQTKFISNTCLDGNGGALALLGTFATFSNGCIFGNNSSPNGGGGAIYIGPDSGTGTLVASILPLFESFTIFEYGNRGAYGSKLAAQPTTIGLLNATLASRIYQVAGQVVSPFLTAAVYDEFGNVVTNVVIFISIAVVNNSAIATATTNSIASSSAIQVLLLTGATTVSTIHGIATFQDLVVNALPNTAIQVQCTATLPSNLGSSVLFTEIVTIHIQACIPPLQYYDEPNRICGTCPPQYVTITNMQLKCQFQFEPGYVLTWIVPSWWAPLGVALLSIGVYATAIPKTVHYLYRKTYNDMSWTVRLSLFIIGLAHAMYAPVLCHLTLQTIAFGSVESGQFQTVAVQVSVAYFVSTLVVSCACSLATFIQVDKWIVTRQRKDKHGSDDNDENEVDKRKQDTFVGKPIGNLVTELAKSDTAVDDVDDDAKRRRTIGLRNRSKSEHSTTRSQSGSGNSYSDSDGDDSANGADLIQPDERIEIIYQNLPPLGLGRMSWYIETGAIQAMSAIANIDMALTATSQYSEWSIVYSRVALYLGIGTILTAAYTGILVALFRLFRPGWSTKQHMYVRSTISMFPTGCILLILWPLLTIASNSKNIKFQNIPANLERLQTMSGSYTIIITSVLALLVIFLFLLTNLNALGKSLGTVSRALAKFKKLAYASNYLQHEAGRQQCKQLLKTISMLTTNQYTRPTYLDTLLDIICKSPYSTTIVDPDTTDELMHRCVSRSMLLIDMFRARKLQPILAIKPPKASAGINDTKTMTISSSSTSFTTRKTAKAAARERTLSSSTSFASKSQTPKSSKSKPKAVIKVNNPISNKANKMPNEQEIAQQLDNFIPRVLEKIDALLIMIEWAKDANQTENIGFLFTTNLYKSAYPELKNRGERLLFVVGELMWYWITAPDNDKKPIERRRAPINISGSLRTMLTNKLANAIHRGTYSDIDDEFFDPAIREILNLQTENATIFPKYNQGEPYLEFIRIMSEPPVKYDLNLGDTMFIRIDPVEGFDADAADEAEIVKTPMAVPAQEVKSELVGAAPRNSPKLYALDAPDTAHQSRDIPGSLSNAVAITTLSTDSSMEMVTSIRASDLGELSP